MTTGANNDSTTFRRRCPQGPMISEIPFLLAHDGLRGGPVLLDAGGAGGDRGRKPLVRMGRTSSNLGREPDPDPRPVGSRAQSFPCCLIGVIVTVRVTDRS